MECRVNELSINYEVIGNGRPIVIIHGYSLDHTTMTACMEPIFKNKSNFKRIYIDLPGMGNSSSAEWIKNSDIMLQIVIDFIDKIIPNENFLLAGYSYGGYLSRGIIYKMESRVDGLLLLCPVIIADVKKRNTPSHTVLKRDDRLLSQLEKTDAKDFDSMHVIQSNYIWDRFKNEMLPAIRKSNNNKFLDDLKKHGYEFSFDVDRLMEKFGKPTLVLLGRQDSIVGYKDAEGILDNYPRSAYAILDRAGHHLHIEQEKLFNALVAEWVERVEEK